MIRVRATGAGIPPSAEANAFVERVSIARPDEGSLVSSGMRALLDEDRIELRSNIRGQFTP